MTVHERSGDLTTREPIRVLILTVSLRDYGPARNLLYLATRCDRRRFRFEVCTMDRVSGGPVEQQFSGQSVPVHRLEMRGPFDLRALPRLLQLLRDFKPTVVHARLARACFYGRLAVHLMPRPKLLANVTGLYSQSFTSGHGRWLGRALYWIERATIGWSDLIVTNSVALADDCAQVVGVPPAKLRTVYNAIDTAAFDAATGRRNDLRSLHGVAPEQVVAISVGRLHPRKRTVELVEWLHASLRRQPAMLLWIVGHGQDRQEVERAVAAHGLSERVRLFGERHDIPELLAAADIFVSASRWEGHPNVVLEAMAAGLPTVAFRVPGMTEAVEDGRTGFLADTPEEFRTAVERIGADAVLRSQYSACARQRVRDRFSVPTMVAAFEGLYEELSGSDGVPG